MAPHKQDGSKRLYSRRSILGMMSLGAAGAVAFGAFSWNKLAYSVFRRKQPPVFPEGSIFMPREDPRMKS